MRMGIQIGAKPDAGFEDPIGMLKDCHRRIEHFLEMVCVVAEQARGRALNEEESAAVKAALHYFRVGGQRHNADEEESLFPRLRATDAAEDVAAWKTTIARRMGCTGASTNCTRRGWRKERWMRAGRASWPRLLHG
jgi:hypothetical protein